MKLALILGSKQNNVIKPKLLGIKDNLEIDCFNMIPEFIDSSIKRNSTYDRILLLSNLVDTRQLRDLYNYWSSLAKETQIVLICKRGVDENKASEFLQLFKTPLVASMLLSSTTLQLIAEAVLRPTSELNDNYGIKDFLAVEVDEDILIEPEKPKPQVVQQPIQQQEQPKKQGLLGKLFGGNKPKTPQQSNTQNNSQSVVDNSTFDFEPKIVEQKPVVQQTTPQNNNFGDFDFGIPSSQSTQSKPVIEPNIQDSGISQNREINYPNTSSDEVSIDVSGFSMDDGFESFDLDSDAFTPEQVTHVDFGADITDYSQMEVDDSEDTIVNVETINTDLSDINISSEEESYRQAEQAPIVKTEVIVREVIRNVSSDTSTLQAVYDGKKRKTIVVTGDRGTGVTSTALNIAQTMAKKVPVLYVDCDIENHGLLNYLDYDRFSNYEDSHKEGIKRCRSTGAFNSCVMKYDDNLDIITSDFSCEITEDELAKAHDIIAVMTKAYSMIVVDCPVRYLHCVDESILTGETVLCVEGSKRGFMNMLTQMELSKLPVRYKGRIADTGVMLVTKCNRDLDLNRLVEFIRSFVELDDANYLNMIIAPFNGQLTDKLLNDMMEG